MDADSIIDYSSYITIHDDPSFFKVAEAGLVVDDTIVYKGDAVFKFDVSIKDGLAKQKEDLSQINFVVELISKGSFGLLSSKYMGKSPTVTISSNQSGTFSNKVNSFIDNGVKSSFTHSNQNLYSFDNVEYSLTYSFDFTDYKDSFKDKESEKGIYSSIGADDFSFLFRVGVSI